MYRYYLVIDGDSFYGKIRTVYSERVLKTQLEQLRKQGSYDAFKLGWHPKYDIQKLHGGKCTIYSPPTLFWDSDVGKWIEAACYFLSSTDGKRSPHAKEFISAIDELITMMTKAQQSDGYLGTYFTVVDKAGKLKNLRDMHEMYNCGHLLEAALAHHLWSGDRRFLNITLKYIDLLMKTFGPGKNQRHGYPGHPELELAVLRLYSRTRDPRHYAFGRYLVAARGKREASLGGKPYFVWEAEQRKDPFFHASMDSIEDGRYHQWHAPLHEQETILGHSVRALYLITAAADLDGQLLEDAKRLWNDCVDNKMYPTGGIGSIPDIEGFSEIPHFLPNGHDEGGCYAETCASIACMMTCERFLTHELSGKVRDVMERCLLNNVLGGASLDGKQFYYANRLSTCGDENADRSDWFDICCCPPNLTRTMGLLGGYMWSVKTKGQTIHLDVYLYISGKRTVELPSGGAAAVEMETEMPWHGRTTLQLQAPKGYDWVVQIPKPEYAVNFNLSPASLVQQNAVEGYISLSLPAQSVISVTFDMPVRLLAPHPATHQDTLAIARGPIIYTAESYDNTKLEGQHRHFEGIGLLETTTFEEVPMEIENIPMITLISQQNVCAKKVSGKKEIGSMTVIGGEKKWIEKDAKLRLVPFFARSNRDQGGRLRTMFPRVAVSDVQ
uniref:Uncharacterized protein n=1 Tax=Kwoniella bestiolae CBS 10118 TaxID=1296100 RepID=A0A1B9G230_9TREE|nr:hypothetical protein I302_04884 [Kwoniella bestiolae CBS 10118]OCF25074.1 hypothetical protein I302_04884 [Kwoniella bestiolae CBS 10118]